MARRLFFVEEIRNGQAEIVGDDALHLTRVLRVEPGQRFEISDNRNVYLAEVETAHKQRVIFRTLERLPLTEPPLHLYLCAALIKFDRFEWMLEKAVELGVETIVPLETMRSEKGLERAAAKRIERWKRILLEASQQSRRGRAPKIEETQTLKNVIGRTATTQYVLEEAAGAAPILHSLPERRAAADTVMVLVGPEGGWAGEEVDQFRGTNWRAVSLGPQILRSETAALAALAILSAAWQAARAPAIAPRNQ
ncbi:MAG TPA: RsmE family RNA methyltransferase [Bryobacteraceae bacterium]|nr:RsmE family RNA methyltransferase [Bryobacteraceae bacterium]